MHFAELHLVMPNTGPLLAALWKVSQCLRTEKMRLHMQRRNTRSRSRHTVRLCLYLTALSKQQRAGKGWTSVELEHGAAGEIHI